MRIIKKSIDQLVPFKVKAISLSSRQMQDKLFSFGCGWTRSQPNNYRNCGIYFFVDENKRIYHSFEEESFQRHTEFQEISENFFL